MGHNNFDKFPKDYTTFAELAEYARRRAKHSASRNGHQEYVYWYEISLWSLTEGAYCDDSTNHFQQMLEGEILITRSNSSTSLKAHAHARAVHLRQILINRGEKPVRLSLDWLREAAEKL